MSASSKDDAKYLQHILECIRRIEEDVTGGRGAFDASHMVQDAVLRNLQVLAESTKRITELRKASRPSFATSWCTITRGPSRHGLENRS